MDMKKTTSKIAKAEKWIINATKSDRSHFFRFVGWSECNGNIYGEWLTPEMANKEVKNHNEYNTLRVEMMVY